jgi:diguanylate cyclase (GGDEF)-like protein
VITASLAALAAWVVLYEVHSAAGLPNLLVFDKLFSDFVMGACGALCVARAVRNPRERAAWGCIGTGVLLWTAGDVYWSTVLAHMETIPIPSPADIGYLAFCPLVFAGLVLLVRSRVAHASRTLWVDGIAAAFAASSLSAAFALDKVLEIVGGSANEVATNLAYPLTDLILIGLVVGAIALTGWGLDRTWIALGLGAVSFWLADSLYLVQTANETYVVNGFVDPFWNAAGVAFAVAAWQQPRLARAGLQGGGRVAWLPVLFAASGLGVLIVASQSGMNVVAVTLASLSLVAVFVRLVMTHHDNVALLRASRQEALTDALTGLGNRRALTKDIESVLPVAGADPSEPHVLALFDLDGFKHYNDSFGHPAGDALLARLGQSLAGHVDGRGRAYRMGGDEFCALLPATGAAAATELARVAAAALSDHGEGFTITCSFGAVEIPREATDVQAALRLADQRMYLHKHGGRASAGRQSRDVLLRALAERTPELGDHVDATAALAGAVAARLGLAREDVEQVRHAAELHDVGKMAIPDEILHKPGPLSAVEWAFMRRHTIIGERIVNAAPALARVAPMVRSSHERWDGGGYPDGLAGDAIPLGARIVAVCDAFDAMTTDRTYRSAVHPEEALAELRRCAGAQFDPGVVDAFAAVWRQQSVTPLAEAA